MEDGRLGLGGLLETRTFISGHSVSSFKVVICSYCFNFLCLLIIPEWKDDQAICVSKETFKGLAMRLCSHVSFFSGL